MADRPKTSGYKPTRTEDLGDEFESFAPARSRRSSVDSIAELDLRPTDFGGRVLSSRSCFAGCRGQNYSLYVDSNGTLSRTDNGSVPSSCMGRAIFCSKKFVKLPVLFFNVVIAADSILLFGFNAKILYDRFPGFSIGMMSALCFCLVLLFWSWYKVLFTPSSVEANPPPRNIHTGHLRRCGKCVSIRPIKPHLGLKPYRAHHCKVCDRCVLKMDHHCVFLAQCIGHFNYKYFCLFVIYAIFSCGLYVAVSIPATSFLGPVSLLPWSNLQAILTAISVLASTVLFVMLIIFGTTHLKLILNCQTTIEYIKAQSLDHGESVLTKLRRVFGDQFWTWFFPIGRPKESGYEWDDPALTSKADDTRIII